MRPLFGTLLGLLFCVTALQAQQSVPVFRTKEDSLVYSTLQEKFTTLRAQIVTETPGSKKHDSLSAVYSQLGPQLMKVMSSGVLRMRTVYRSDPLMTSYADMVRLGRPSEVRKLSIPGNGRSELPDSLFLCKNLEELELVNWKIERLPRRLKRLSHLREIAILNNQPKGHLKLSRNKSIKELNIRGDEANGHLPRHYRALRNLETLDLSRNNLTQFPKLSGSRDLKKVVLLFNDLTLDDLNGRQPSSILEINFANNKIKSVPASIAEFKSVKKLNFSNNQIDSVSPRIGSLKELEELAFYKNRLTSIPPAVYELPRLRVIDLYYNDISQADARLCQMKSLEILYLANNRLYTLPNNLGQLAGLKELYLHHNRLSNLPESVGEMKSLTVLRVNDNQLLEFPEFIHGLEGLQNLDISHNQIQALAMNDFAFRNLKIFSLVGNPWDEPTRQALPAFAEKLRQNKTVVHLNSFEETVE
jgi:Leucine-rich repeat (LRR) protein